MLMRAVHEVCRFLQFCKIAAKASASREAEVFTATTELEPLIETLGKVTNDLENYIEKEKKRLNVLENQLRLYKKEYVSSTQDVPKYLENPINAFKIIKRLTTDLKFTERSIHIGAENIKSVALYSDDLMYPTLEDLKGSVAALTRLKNTYELKINELAEGILAGEACSIPMTSSDCFVLGKTLFEKRRFKTSKQWLMEALRKYEAEGDVYDISFVDILQYIRNTYYKLNKDKAALEWTKKISELNTNSTETLKVIGNFHGDVDKKENTEANNRTKIEKDEDFFMAQVLAHEVKVYEALCRGDIEIPQEISKRLKCTFLTGTHPFLKLAPIKMEQMYIGPDIYVFHQVISDEEIEHIKNMAKPKFQRAIIFDPQGRSRPAHYRISKSAWLSDRESPVVGRLSKRISHFTGLDMGTAELLQIGNYGIGGHYEPHFDFALSHVKPVGPFNENVGNRIATVLFYMSEVAQGGATAFTELGLSVFPVKNSALFWMNLHPSGEGDISTRHAACPVLRGSKWVSNKWIHQVGQEFLKPCNLEHQKEGVMGKDPIPVKAKAKSEDHNELLYSWYRSGGIQKLINRRQEQHLNEVQS
ncbi:unnamed protein product, partial [Iphiclides podalirius]